MTPLTLWRRLTADERYLAVKAYWNDPDTKRQADEMLLAQYRKARPVFYQRMEEGQKLRELAKAGTEKNSPISPALFLRSWHLLDRKDLLIAFLDGCGIPHQDGAIDDESPLMTEEGLAKGLAALQGKGYAERDIAIYFSTLLTQDAITDEARWALLSPHVDAFWAKQAPEA